MILTVSRSSGILMLDLTLNLNETNCSDYRFQKTETVTVTTRKEQGGV